MKSVWVIELFDSIDDWRKKLKIKEVNELRPVFIGFQIKFNFQFSFFIKSMIFSLLAELVCDFTTTMTINNQLQLT